MVPFRALFEARNNDLIDAFYGTVIMITSDNGQHFIWYLDHNNELKTAASNSYKVKKVD
jgi:hypothetical protein